MNAREFFDLVRELRKAQKEYYQTLSSEAMYKAVKLERKVDDEIARVERVLSEREKNNKRI